MSTTTINMRRRLGATGAVCLGLLLIVNIAWCQADDKPASGAEQVEPPFPSLISSQKSQYQTGTIKLVTETIVKDRPITTQEEYLDLNQGKAAYVLTDSQEIVYTNAREDQVLKYKPYTCQAFGPNDHVFTGVDDWSLKQGSYQYHSLLRVETKTLRLFGAAAMWIWAESQAKVYSRGSVQYELSKEIYAGKHIWTIQDPQRGEMLEFHFIAHNKAPDAELSLESIKLISTKGNQLLKSINILSIDYTLSLHVYENLLSFPVGYDCVKVYAGTGGLDDASEKDGKLDKPLEDDFWTTYAWSNSRVTFEVTATKMEELSEIGVRSTDTMVVEIAHARIGTSIGANEMEGDLLMTRVKSSQQETKTVLNHLYSTVYHIDSQRGTCSMRHFRWDEQANYMNEQDRDNFGSSLKFSNDLRLSMNKKRLKEMFGQDSELFKPVKSYRRFVGDNKQMVYQVLERPTYDYAFEIGEGGKSKYNNKVVAREMQTMVMSQTVAGGGLFGGETQDTSEWKLDSHTIWLLDKETQTQILATFHLNVIDEEGDLDVWPDQASLFDVSEECYLNDPTMKSGRDYAWVELFYPIASRQMDLLIEQEFRLKQTIYDSLMKLPLLTGFAMPRLELMFSDEGLIVRFLILDLPSLEIIYDSVDNKALAKKKYVQEFTVPDVAHCAKLCQMYSCLTMTFCDTQRLCLITPQPADLYGIKKVDDASKFAQLTPLASCVTYGTTRPSLMNSVKNQRLSNVISTLQHQDYDNIKLPATPDEVALPREETGVDEEGYRKALGQYIAEVSEYLVKEDHRLPSTIISVMLNGHFVVALPTRFTVENDPLNEMALDYSSDSPDGSSAAAAVPSFQDSILFDMEQIDKFFHIGLPRKRFDVNVIMKQPFGMRIIQGISYDQCALACLDSKCGTFSHCTSSNECILTNVAAIKAFGETDPAFLDDSNCLIMQRDFVQNFQMFPNVLVPAKEDVRHEDAGYTVNDCALHCAHQYKEFCLSFEYCEPEEEGKQGKCYLHDKRHPESIFARPETSKSKKKQSGSASATAVAANTPATSDKQASRCDHYERSYLAEFTHIEGREIIPDELAKLKTTEILGKTTFNCAEICLNQMTDCSAFQFCYDPKKKKRSLAQSCTFIQSRPESEKERKELEVVVETSDDLDVAQSQSSLMLTNSNCQLFALKANSLQAHLRDLAMGETMTTQEKWERDQQAKQGGGHSFTWLGFISLVFFLMIISTLVGYGFSWARVNNEQFRGQIDRLRMLVRL